MYTISEDKVVINCGSNNLPIEGRMPPGEGKNDDKDDDDDDVARVQLSQTLIPQPSRLGARHDTCHGVRSGAPS